VYHGSAEDRAISRDYEWWFEEGKEGGRKASSSSSSSRSKVSEKKKEEEGGMEGERRYYEWWFEEGKEGGRKGSSSSSSSRSKVSEWRFQRKGRREGGREDGKSKKETHAFSLPPSLPPQTPKFQVLITTPEMCIAVDHHHLADLDWAVLVVDEAHRLKNTNSRLSLTLRERFAYGSALLLTGTPLQNDLQELFCLLSFADPEVSSSPSCLPSLPPSFLPPPPRASSSPSSASFPPSLPS
jgi:hypothetical protein